MNSRLRHLNVYEVIICKNNEYEKDVNPCF